MSEFKISTHTYNFNCPNCGANFVLRHDTDKFFRIECYVCHSIVNVDASEIGEYNPDPDKLFELGLEQYNLDDFNKAKDFFEEAAKCNHPLAIYYLGNIYNYGLGVANKSLDQAYKCYSKAASMGCDKAMNKLALWYWDGHYIEQNKLKAKELFLKAAENGNVNSMYNLGLLLTENNDYNSEELKAAIYWLNKAADLGLNISYNKIGDLLEENGELNSAFEYYLKAANAGAATGQYNTARFLKNGSLIGNGSFKRVDYKEAFYWAKLSAAQYYGLGMYILGECYMDGIGVVKNINKAACWYQKAADKNISFAQFELGVLYINSKDIPRDLNKAKNWLNKAYDNGLEEAKQYLDILKSEDL